MIKVEIRVLKQTESQVISEEIRNKRKRDTRDLLCATSKLESLMIRVEKLRRAIILEMIQEKNAKLNETVCVNYIKYRNLKKSTFIILLLLGLEALRATYKNMILISLLHVLQYCCLNIMHVIKMQYKNPNN